MDLRDFEMGQDGDADGDKVTLSLENLEKGAQIRVNEFPSSAEE